MLKLFLYSKTLCSKGSIKIHLNVQNLKLGFISLYCEKLAVHSDDFFQIELQSAGIKGVASWSGCERKSCIG